MSVEFKDYSVHVKSEINNATIAWLYEASGELQAQVKRNTPRKGDWFRRIYDSWTYVVDESEGVATIGNPLQSAIWTEFGTGEYAIHGDGRKGFWVYVKGEGDPNATSKGGKAYTEDEAKKIVAMMRADGLDAHMTKGQRPYRALQSAINTCKKSLLSRYATLLKGMK